MTRLIWLLLLLVPVPAAAAARFDATFGPAEATAAFDQATSSHNRGLRDLYRTRGLPPPRMDLATIATVRLFLSPGRVPDPYPRGSAILFYSLQEGRLSAWLVTAEGLKAASRRDLRPEELGTAIRRLRLSLRVDGIARSRAPFRIDERPEAEAAQVPDRKRALAQLAAMLLPEPIVAGLDGVEHLLIVSNGAIATVPHAILPAGKGRMLIDRATISVSAGLFDADQMIEPWRGRAEFRQALIVGDPAVPPDPRWSVARLQGAAAEARSLAALVSTEALVGSAARKDAVMRRIGSASILYFAAHGVSDPKEPLTGGLLMLAGDSSSDAYLLANEVKSLSLRASLAVLSACQSGLGMLHDGGVIGLSRSFQKAGVPRVVMSLWSVSDDATTFLMARFNRHVLTMTPAVALRRAMLETRKDYPEPSLWAPFVLFGTPR